jgi:redox-sensitive bicupin YhaK (pirin superfamily)
LEVGPGHTLELPLLRHFEHAFLVLTGDAMLDHQPLEERALYYVGSTRSEAHISSRGGCRILLIGGPPFPEQILMWWNFVARTQDEIAQARADWEDRRRFGEVAAYRGHRLSAPTLVRFARPNPVS